MNAEDFFDANHPIKVKIDRPLGSKHPEYDYVYPVNYGFVPNTTGMDGEEIDAYILGIEEPLEEFTGRVIGILRRTNDDDDKLIVTDGRRFTEAEIRTMTHFQEQFFESIILLNHPPSTSGQNSQED